MHVLCYFVTFVRTRVSRTLKCTKEFIFIRRRYFINDIALNDHFTTKVHKRRLKALELEPYSIEESERAAGKGSYIAPQKRKIETISRDSCKMDVESDIPPKTKIAKVDA